MAYQPPDFLNLNDLLTEEERILSSNIRSWVSDQAIPVIAQHHRAGTFPNELIPQMAELGLLGPTLDRWGCAGVGYVAYGLMMRELERCDSGLRSFASVQGSLVMHPIAAFGTEAQQERWLPAMAKGEAIGCFGLTEPDYGSNPGGMLTKAEKTSDGYRLNGTKRWITNGSISDVGIVWAKTDDGSIGGFLVETGAPGYEIREIEGKFSMRASVTSELILSDCLIPESARLPKAKGLKAPFACLSNARYGIAWGALGAAEACYCEAVEYAKERQQFSGPLAKHQLIQYKLAGMLTEITKGGLVAWRLGRLMEEKKHHHAQISMAKMNNVRIALETARAARDILGANGITDAYQTIRHLLNLETVNTYEGTHDIHRLILGREITGIPAFD